MKNSRDLRAAMIEANPLYKKLFADIEAECESAASQGMWSCDVKCLPHDENGERLSRIDMLCFFTEVSVIAKGIAHDYNLSITVEMAEDEEYGPYVLVNVSWVILPEEDDRMLDGDDDEEDWDDDPVSEDCESCDDTSCIANPRYVPAE